MIDPGRARAQARVDARLSTMAISIQQHADRVAAKRDRDGLAAAPTAQSRLDALRRRVASRCSTAIGGTAAQAAVTGFRSDRDVAPPAARADAATRAAHHGVADVPGDEPHRLSR